MNPDSADVTADGEDWPTFEEGHEYEEVVALDQTPSCGICGGSPLDHNFDYLAGKDAGAEQERERIVGLLRKAHEQYARLGRYEVADAIHIEVAFINEQGDR